MKFCLCQSAHKMFEPTLYSDGIKQHACWSALQELYNSGGRDARFTCDANNECVPASSRSA